jgi:polysaccharide biosynthesis protein PslG
VISGEPLPDAAELDRMGGGKVGTLRVNLAWGTVETAPGAAYDWSHYDSVIGEAAKNGIRVLPTVYSSPVWAEPSPEYPPLGDRLPEFEDFARAAVQRYGSDGTFWKTNPEIPKLPITLWQLWNEPNSPLFWKPAPDVGAYVELLASFDSTVERADPKAQVMLGGLFPTPKGGISMKDFMTRLYRGGAQGHFDAAAIHPYAANPANALASVADLRNVMDGAGDRDARIWITEVGWASGGEPSGLTVSPAQQADYLTRTFELAAQQRERLGIDGVIWYSLNDAPGSVWPAHCGLFSLDGGPKPSWDAFVALTGGTS